MPDKLRLDALPEFISTADIARIMNIDLEPTREFVRRHRAALKPFKFGREVRCRSEYFVGLIRSLETASDAEQVQQAASY